MCDTAFRRMMALLSVGIDPGRAPLNAAKPELIDLTSRQRRFHLPFRAADKDREPTYSRRFCSLMRCATRLF